jgi:hypothetical protein
LEVDHKARASLFKRNVGKSQQIWKTTLSALPASAVVTDDGKRVILFDYYYGNKGYAKGAAITFLDEQGRFLAMHKLADVADLTKVLVTTSTAVWLDHFKLSADRQSLEVYTLARKREGKDCLHVNSAKEADDCSDSKPYELLKFSVNDGGLVSRVPIPLR